MTITLLREGPNIRTAAKFQTAPGVPVTVWTDADILRADEAPAPDPQVQSGTGNGKFFERDEGVSQVRISPLVEGVFKANPPTVLLFVESLLGIVPTGGATKIFDGAASSTKRFTYIWDSGIETIKAVDCLVRTLEFNSRANENLVMRLNAPGQDLPPRITPNELNGEKLISFNTYAHKDSGVEDIFGTAVVELCVIEQTLLLEREVFEEGGNKFCPNLIQHDGRIKVTGSIVTRLSAESIPFFDRLLATNRGDLDMEYVDQSGKNLKFFIRNATFEGTTLPRVDGEGRLENFTINFTARLKETPSVVNPIKIEVDV